MTSREPSAYVLPVPQGHRTDWGQAFIEALEEMLQARRPGKLDRERSGSTGGQLWVRLIHADNGQEIAVALWEDEAVVRFDSVEEHFKLATRPQPRGWIPEAVRLVERLLAGQVAVRTEMRAGRAIRREIVDAAGRPSSDLVTPARARSIEWWTGSSFL